MQNAQNTILDQLRAIPHDLEDDADDAVSAGSIRMWETPIIDSKLTLAELLALAPLPSEVRAYEAFQDTVRTAITSGLVTA